MKRKLHVVALLFIMVFMCLSMTVRADELVTEQMDTTGILQEGGLLKEQPVTYALARTTVVSDTEGAKAALIKALDELALEVNLAEFHISCGDAINTLLRNTLNENPAFFYAKIQDFLIWNDGTYVTKVELAYQYDAETLIQKKKEYKDAVDSILANVDSSWSDLEKALYANDYLALHCEYDTTYSNYNAYNVLVEKTAVCQGYALAFMELMNQMGVECEMVTSDALNHAWNLVKIGSTWYHADVTWADPINDRLGRARHIYFLKSQEYFMDQAATDRRSHYAADYVFSGTELSNESANNMGFDEETWNNIDSAFWYYDDAWYAIQEVDNTTANLNVYSISNEGLGEATVEKTIEAKWDTHNSNSYWPGSYSYTWLIGDELFYNLPKKIVSYNLVTKKETELYSFEDDTAIEGRIYELKVDGVNVCYGLALTPNEDTERKTIVLSHEHSYGEIEDCTEDTLCTTCGQIAVEANASHEAVGTQSNCLEAVKCKNCKQNAIEAKTSHSYGTIADCTVATQCTACDQIAVEAKEGHVAGEITDCTQATKCINCEQTAIEAGNHSHGAIEDCTEDTLCTTCGQIAVEAKASHEAVGTQSNCLEAVKCKNCNQNAIEAKASHAHGDIIDCTKETLCTVCGQIAIEAKGHTPGVAATCTMDQKCITCNTVLEKAYGHNIYEIVTEANFLNAKTVARYCSNCQSHLDTTIFGDKMVCKRGKTYIVGSCKYKIISNKTNGTGTVAFVGLAKNVKKVVIGDTVTIHGVEFKIIQVAAKALRKKNKVTSVTIGKNITVIGKEAFYGTSKCKTVTIKSKKIKSVGKNALKGIYKKAKIKVPKSRLSKYKKLFKGKGQKSSVKITK